jgi:Predicted metal-binding integral membrane protein (DUF2182)
MGRRTGSRLTRKEGRRVLWRCDAHAALTGARRTLTKLIEYSEKRNEDSSIQGHGILTVLPVMSFQCWASLAWDYPSSAMNMRLPYTMGLSLTPFLLIWLVMMVAMMFPTAAPMILTFHKIQRRRTACGAYSATWAFVSGYLPLWALTGIAAYVLARGAEAATTWFHLGDFLRAPRRRRLDNGRRLSVHAAEGFLPVAMQHADRLHHDLLARRNGGRSADGLVAWYILLWLLLASFCDFVPAGHAERHSDGGDYLAHPCRENVAVAQADSARIGRRSYRLWGRRDRHAGIASDISGSFGMGTASHSSPSKLAVNVRRARLRIWMI